MYREYFWLCIILLLNGCAVIDGYRSSEVPPDRQDKTKSYQTEKQALFEQPYIDPLTDYLIEYQGDPARESVLSEVRQERDHRCKQIADQYAGEPATTQVLQQFNTGYAYSCPEQVAAFEKRVNRQVAKSEQEPKPEAKLKQQPEPEVVQSQIDSESEQRVSDQVLSDCYLLTTIRNFSEAKEVCREPAEHGDLRSQANMALVAYAFEDYTSAFNWAEKAAPNSAEAAFLLGQMYAKSHGVAQNLDQALNWYKEAARQGHQEAKAIIDRQKEGSPASDL